MAKQNNLESAIGSLLGGDQQRNEQQEPTTTGRRGRPRTNEGYERRTFQIKESLVRKLKLLAAKEGVLQKDLLEFALEEIIGRYEQKHGKLGDELNDSRKNIRDLF